jgi:hypothetical protein
MFRRTTLAALLVTLAGTTQAANDIDTLGNINVQNDFRLLSEDLGAALSYKAVIPAEPLGLTGFDISLEGSSTKLEHADILKQATGGDSGSTLVVPKLHVHKGLPLGIDVGAFYSAVPDSNIKLWGAELRYALLKGGTATPAVALRASYSTLQGVSQLDFDTKGVDISISKGFTLLTPYAGIGKVWVNSTPIGVPPLVSEDFSYSKLFAGVNLNFGLVNIAVETDKTGDATSYSVKFGWRL